MTYVGVNKVIALSRQAAARALNESARAVADQAIADVPKLTGHLASSAEISWASADHLLARVEFTAPYAAAVHEGLPREDHERGHGEHYLANALYMEVPNLPVRVERELRAQTAGGPDRVI